MEQLDQQSLDMDSVNCFKSHLQQLRNTRMGFFVDWSRVNPLAAQVLTGVATEGKWPRKLNPDYSCSTKNKWLLLDQHQIGSVDSAAPSTDCCAIDRLLRHRRIYRWCSASGRWCKSVDSIIGEPCSYFAGNRSNILCVLRKHSNNIYLPFSSTFFLFNHVAVMIYTTHCGLLSNKLVKTSTPTLITTNSNYRSM